MASATLVSPRAEDLMEQLEAEQSRTIARSADDVWRVLATLKGAAMPNIVERADTRGDVGGSIVQRIQFSDDAYMVQRLVDRDDEARVLRLELVASEGMPLGEYRSIIRVEPEGDTACRVSVRCTGSTETDAHLVRAMLRDLLTMSLDELAKRMEATR
jgi:hypothetical protein